MSTITVFLSIVIALMPGSDGGGGESGVVYICPGRTQIFMCEVPKQQGSLTRLEWRIDFEHSSRPSEESVTRLFTSDDPEGHILRESRPGITFMFNLTSNGSSSLSLVSVMSVIVDDINATALINNATVNCGDEANQKMLHIIEGPPSSLMNLTHNLMRVQWNAAALADHYIVSLSPLIDDNESESTFITSNTTIHLPLRHNQDYNISVMASNCAGNSTPVKISMRVATESESDIDVRLISITASLLVFAVLTFITGFLMGSLLVKHVMKSPKQDTVPGPGHGSVPLYEEITRPPSNSAFSNGEVMNIKDNEAYGCI